MPDSPSRILVVDDNAQNLALAQATLEEEGFEVELAQNGKQGIEAFARRPPDCVLLDVRMPDLDGFGVSARLRELPGGKETPIIFVTALRDVDTFDRAQLAGADDFLTKPVRPPELVARVQAVLKLRRMNADLRGLYDVVRHQRDDLMRLQLQKERLSAFVVHDLKNPVTAMDLMAQVLASDREAPERVRTTALQIRSEARALMRLILNLLDISKSEEGKLEPRRVRLELPHLVQEAFESVEAKATLHDVRLERQLSVTQTTADPDLLRRVVENLLDNAIRHTPSGGRVRLVAEAADGDLLLHVEDSGRGVPEEMREKIFDPFVQDEAGRHPTRSGRGLGLTFCRLAVQAHAGSIHVEDAAPGARFVVRIPKGQ